MSSTITPADLLNTVTVEKLRKEAESLKIKKFSDIYDNQGNQYVDLVQEGGGVLGIALLGYTYILEEAGIRFFNLAGTSAGSINALLMAGIGSIGEKKSNKIIDYVCNQNLFDFVDGHKSIKRLIQQLIDKKGKNWMFRILIRTPIIYKKITKQKGFNPGLVFEKWLSSILVDNGINNLQDLENRLQKLPLLFVDGKTADYSSAELAIITSEVTTMTKVRFPQMTSLYWAEPEKMNPAKLVRASMSIPFFFEPFSVQNLPFAGKLDVPSWKLYAGYPGVIPNKVDFVDGGMLSNFPINAFHLSNNIPKKPTFGVRLSAYRQEHKKTENLSGFLGSMINTMRQVYDLDFLLRNPDYKQLICRIDADQSYNWLNFNMTKQEKIELFQLGAQKGLEFLHKFNWKTYKLVRKELLNQQANNQVNKES